MLAAAATATATATTAATTTALVHLNNRLVSRVVLLLEVAHQRRVVYIIEQPESSLMWSHPRLQKTIKRHMASDIHMHMGAFGGPTPKGTVLMGTAPYLGHLEKLVTKRDKCDMKLKDNSDMTRNYLDANGEKRFTAGPKMTASQAYPIGLGAGHARAFDAWYSSRPAAIEEVHASESESESGLSSEYDSDEDCLDDVLTGIDCFAGKLKV